jgi:hypothetical protein
VQTFYRWRQEYGGLQVDQPKRLKKPEKENGKLKRLVAELSLDRQILKGIAETSKPGTPSLRPRTRQRKEVSERRASQLVRQWRGTQRYRPPRRTDEDGLSQMILALATKYVAR